MSKMSLANDAPGITAAALHTTGLPVLDVALQGGLRAGTLTVIVADPSDVQELALMHVALAGGPSTYICVDRRPDELVRQWRCFDMDGSGVAFQSPNATTGLEALPAAGPGARIIIDSFSRYAALLGWGVAADQLQALRRRIAQTGEVAVMVVFPALHAAAEMAWLHMVADGVLEIVTDKALTSQITVLRIAKMRGVVWSAKGFPAAVHRDGLFLEAVKRVL